MKNKESEIFHQALAEARPPAAGGSPQTFEPAVVRGRERESESERARAREGEVVGRGEPSAARQATHMCQC